MAQKRYYSSTAKQASLSASIDSVITSISLDLVTGFPSNYPYSLVIDPDTNKEEIITVNSSGGGTSLNVLRGEDGSTNISHAAGATVRHIISGRDFNEFSEHIGSAATPTASGIHGVGGTLVGTTDTQTLSAKTLTAPKIATGGFIADANGNEQIIFNTTTSAVNEFTVTNAATGTNPSLAATGGDTNISVNIVPKGTGTVQATGVDVATISGTQTLSNKSISLTSNTVTGTKAQFNTAMSDADFATLAGSETLTNKSVSLTSNTITGTTAEFNTALSDNDFATLAGSETLTNKTVTSPIVTGLTLNDSTITFEGSSADASETFLTVVNPTSDRTIYLPDASGTITLDGVASTLTSKTITSGTLGSDLAAGTYKITGLGTPSADTDAATKGYVNTQIAVLTTGAPDLMNTLDELADALGNDVNFSTTVATNIAAKVAKAGDSMTGALSMGNNKITDLATPTLSSDATNKSYIDTLFGSTSAAATSATSASNSASAASTSASSASTSATSAATSASSASTSATSAAASATAAAASYDAFDDRYLGAKSTAPTVDNDGDTLLVGATYWNSSLSTMYAWSGSAWIAISSTSAVSGVTGTANRITSTGGSTPNIDIASAYDDERIVVDLMDIY